MSFKRVRTDTGIDITPMIDVVFLLVFFFMMTTNFIRESGFNVDLPSARSGDTVITKKITIGITRAGQIFVNKKKVNAAELIAELRVLAGQRDQPAAVIHADKDTAYKRVIRVMESARLAGVRNVSLVIRKEIQ